jgi:hypothetical protein
MDSKNIFKSKTFWFNVALAAATMSDTLPPKYGVPVGVAGNLMLRILTNQPASIPLPDFSQKKDPTK